MLNYLIKCRGGIEAVTPNWNRSGMTENYRSFHTQILVLKRSETLEHGILKIENFWLVESMGKCVLFLNYEAVLLLDEKQNERFVSRNEHEHIRCKQYLNKNWIFFVFSKKSEGECQYLDRIECRSPSALGLESRQSWIWRWLPMALELEGIRKPQFRQHLER